MKNNIILIWHRGCLLNYEKLNNFIVEEKIIKKYILSKRNNGETVFGFSTDPNDFYHKDIGRRLGLIPSSGGSIKFDPMLMEITLSGLSGEYGKADHSLTKKILSAIFKSWKIKIEEKE